MTAAWTLPAAAPAAAAMPPGLVSTGLLDTDAFGAAGVFLRPGDWLFGRGAVRVSTLLGSCVALVLWSPRHRLGAVCHCVLPARPGPAHGAPLDGRFGEETGQWLDERLAEHGCAPGELRAMLAGGASGHDGSIGEGNIAWAQRWAAQRQVPVVQQDVGGHVVRRLTFNLSDGNLAIAHGGRLAGAPR